MKIREYIQVKPAGGSPDPATFCPTNNYFDPDDPDSGVIWNPILPADGWNLLATFQNNSPYTTTFDPSITASSGDYAWYLGDGSIIIDKAISHTYLTTATRTVKLYGKGTCVITQIDFSNDHIIGTLDLSNSAFAASTYWDLFTNPSLTSVLFPSSVTGAVRNFNIYGCNLTGTLDASAFNNWQNQGFINLSNNSNLTEIMWAGSFIGVSGISALNLGTTGLTGIVDLSVFVKWSGNTTITINSCPNITEILWPAGAMVNYVQTFNIYNNASLTSLDLSNFSSVLYPVSLNFNITGNTVLESVTLPDPGTKTVTYLNVNNNAALTSITGLSEFTNFTNNATINLSNNPNITEFVFASSITGEIGTLNLFQCGITGILDLSKFTTFFSTVATINLYSNASMTGVSFASSITGTIANISIYSTGITGTLDLSKFTTFTATAVVDLHANTSMTGVTFKSTAITGIIRTLHLYSNTSLGYVDVTKLNSTGVVSLAWRFEGNGWSAAIVNQVLVDIDGISASGYASRVVNVGGSNTDPDTTSGGVDGVAARTALQGKSFTVTIT